MKAQIKLIVCLVTILSLLTIYSNVMASTDDVYFGVSLQRYVEEPANSAMLTLFAGNLSGKRITLDEISIFREGSDEPFRKIQVGKELTQLSTNLSSQDCKTMIHPNIDEVVDKNTRAQFFKVNGNKLFMCIEEVNLSEILNEIRPDQVFRLKAIARFNVDGKDVAVEDKGVGYYAPRPNIKDATVESSDTSGDSILAVPSGWSKIAPHVHTKYSDGAPTISVRTWMQTATAAGFKGIVFNDHNDMVTSTEYTQRANDISNSSDVAIVADDSYELTTSVDSHGIAIGYSAFDNAIRTEVGQMSQAASNGALAGPAHPNNGIYYWYEHDFADITIKTTELGESGVYSSGNIGYWDQYLLQGDWLANTISSGNFVIGIGGSDAHYDPADVLDAVTWVKSTWSVTPPKSSKTVIKNAIAAKRVSFGFKTHTFADMSLSQGTTLYMGGKGGLNNSSTINITVSHVPLGDVINNVTNVRLYRYDNTVGGLVSRNYSPSSAESTSITLNYGDSLMPSAQGSGYYRALITVSHTDPDGHSYTGYALTNPIFYY